MHFTVERQPNAVPVSLSKPAPPPAPPPCRQPSYSISELIYARDDQISLISERQSSPCLRLPLSHSKAVHPRINTPTAERPRSSASTVSSRRSVSGMKQLLPLRLQAAPPMPKVDLSSWLEDAVPHLQSPIGFGSDCESTQGSSESRPIPWMWSGQDEQLANDVPPSRYRETPIYSDPGSPILSRAYFSDEDSYYRCPSTSSVCDELCIVGAYEEIETTDSYSQTSFARFTDTFDEVDLGSAETSPTSFASSGKSTLSIQCQGEFILPDEAAWISSPVYRCVETSTPSIIENSEIEIADVRSAHEGWIDSESSRSSSPRLQDTLCDAFVTRLSPARAQMIQVTKAIGIVSESPPPLQSYKQTRPPTPYRQSKRKTKRLASPYSRRAHLSDEDITPKQSQKDMPPMPPLPIPQPSPQLLMPEASPPIPLPSLSNPRLIETANYPHIDPSTSNAETRVDVIETIREFVRAFPERMLNLQTLCVVHIRCGNNINHQSAASLYVSEPPKLSKSSSPLTKSRWQNTTANLFGPIRRSSSVKDPAPKPSIASMPLNGSPSKGPMASRPISSPLSLRAPDLPAFRIIFPATDDRWRNVLYAHLLAYNYIRDSQALPKPPHCLFTPKVSNTLGIPRGLSTPSIPTITSSSDRGLLTLQHDLAACISYLTSYMVGRSTELFKGRYSSSSGSPFGSKTAETDLTLVRALAEIVRGAEQGGGGEEKLPGCF